MILLDVTIVNVALPAIQHGLNVTPANLVWVINAYVLVLASLILVAGRLGDRHGRRLVFMVGLVAFTAGSAACALAPDDPELIAFRAVQGVGAALLGPLALSILTDAFPPERAWAIGLWATVAGLGFGSGPILGGVLIAAFDWSAIFWVNVPVGIAAVVLTWTYVRESRDPRARRLDLPGATLVAAGLFCATFALVGTEQRPWDSPVTVGFLAAAVVLLAGFLGREATAGEPMLPLGFFRRRRFAAPNLVFGSVYGALAATLFYVALYFQNVKGYTALEVGLSWLTMNVPFLVCSLNTGLIQARLGDAFVLVGGAMLGGLARSGLRCSPRGRRWPPQSRLTRWSVSVTAWRCRQRRR